MQSNPNAQATRVVPPIIAIALVLPFLGMVFYGFAHWPALAGWTVGAMALTALLYYLLLRMMMRYRNS